MKLHTFVISMFTLLLSLTSHAGVMSYKDFSYDTANNYVQGSELQWLRWTETANSSLDDAKANDVLSAQGWQVATQDQVSGLLNNWFGKARNFKFFPGAQELETYQTFQSFFAKTDEKTDSFWGDIISSQAMFAGKDGKARLAEVVIDGDTVIHEIDSVFNQASAYASANLGVVMVRTAQVSEPANFALLCSGLMGLWFVRRRKV